MFNFLKPKQEKVFDWHKAIKIIKKHKIKNCSAGLLEDENTIGVILIENKPQTKNFHYLQSYWATPILKDMDTGKNYECWTYENETNFNAKSDWTEKLIKEFDNYEI